MEKYTVISHDAYDRTEIIRRPTGKGHECAWCGQPAKFEYGTLADGICTVPNWDNRVFCSIQCRRTYY